MLEISVSFDGVTFGYQQQTPLFRDMTCKLTNGSSGRVVALMGPSGVGKSTFCDLIMGVRRASAGSIVCKPQNALLAMVPQRSVLFEELDISANVSCLRYSGSLGHTFSSDRAGDAVRSLGLASLMERDAPVSTLSGGEGQRVMLARAASVEPHVLVLDEPCASLDNKIKDGFLRDVRGFVDARGVLGLFVTHVWQEASSIADEVLFFRRSPGSSVVEVLLMGVADAQSNPPDIDTLFATRWPLCAVVPTARFVAAMIPEACQVSAEAAFAGIAAAALEGAQAHSVEGSPGREIAGLFFEEKRGMLREREELGHIVGMEYWWFDRDGRNLSVSGS